ncbi:hypothetical protein ACA910_004929 [Epithemia clementina (nom. ined.)]
MMSKMFQKSGAAQRKAAREFKAVLFAPSQQHLARSSCRMISVAQPRFSATVVTRRCFRSSSIRNLGADASAASGTASSSSTSTTAANTEQSAATPTKKPEKNLFLDNLGTIFLTAIGLIIAYLIRSYIGSTRRNKLRDELEERATLDPLEIDELRMVNPGVTASVFRSMLHELWSRYPDGTLTYDDFAQTIRELLVKQHQIPTIEFGHLLDRVVISILEQHGQSSSTPQSITLWMTVLSMALNSSIKDRVQLLHEILLREEQEQQQEQGGSNRLTEDGVVYGDGNKDKNNNSNNTLEGSSASHSNNSKATVRVDKVRQLVQYLQESDQLVIETQLTPTASRAFPIQQYHRGSPQELMKWEGPDSEPIDVKTLGAILRSRSVCAWGECYRKSYDY